MKEVQFEEVLPCVGKLAFDTKKEATTISVTAEYQRGAKLKAYKCQYCRLWHLATDYE